MKILVCIFGVEGIKITTVYDLVIHITGIGYFIIKFRYNARSDWLKQRALSEYRCTE